MPQQRERYLPPGLSCIMTGKMDRLDAGKILRAHLAWLWPPSRRRGETTALPSTSAPRPPADRAVQDAARKVQGRRITFTGGPAGLEIVIPAQRNLSVILFLGVWLLGWCAGEISAITRLVGGPQTDSWHFVLVWLVLWTLGGAFAAYTWLWNLVGKERIVLGPSTLSLKRDILGMGRISEYLLYRVRGLRVAPAPGPSPDKTVALRIAGLVGSICFDYDATTISFGGGLARSEAELIVERMRQRYPFPEQQPSRTS